MLYARDDIIVACITVTLVFSISLVQMYGSFCKSLSRLMRMLALMALMLQDLGPHGPDHRVGYIRHDAVLVVKRNSSVGIRCPDAGAA